MADTMTMSSMFQTDSLATAFSWRVAFSTAISPAVSTVMGTTTARATRAKGGNRLSQEALCQSKAQKKLTAKARPAANKVQVRNVQSCCKKVVGCDCS